MDSDIEDFKLTSIIIELISGIIFFSLLLCEYKANKKKLINHIDLDNHGAYRFISKEAKIILDEVK